MGGGSKHINGKNSWLKHLDFILIDVFSLIISFVVAYYIRFGTVEAILSSNWKVFMTISCLLDLVLILFTAPFSGIFKRSAGEELITSFIMTVENLVMMCFLLFVLHIGIEYSRLVLIIMYSIHFLFSFAARCIWKVLLKKGMAVGFANKVKTILVIGEKTDMPQLLSSINSGFLMEYEVKGVCLVDGKIGEKVFGHIDILDESGNVIHKTIEVENITDLNGIADCVVERGIEEVFVGAKPSILDGSVYRKLVEEGKPIHIMIDRMIGFKSDSQFITTVGTFKTLEIGVYSLNANQMVYLVFKRFLDIMFGLVGFVFMIPLAVLVKLSFVLSGDFKSIFYAHTRIGLNGKPFRMYKFRSMVNNADEILLEMLKDPTLRKEWDENQKFGNDPRITKMGRLLRKTSLDEIPQVLNVLKGDMSLIGPRPLVEGELEAHNGLRQYNLVKPGISGWWGCNGRSNTTYDERLELEYYYVRNCSLHLDVLCFLKTISALVRRDGAK